MSGKFKDSKLMQTIRSIRITRSALVTIVTVVIVASAIIAITISANRAARKRPAETNATETPPSNSVAAVPDDKPPVIDVSEQLPSFILPVAGSLSSKHDPELQVYSTTMNDYRVHLGIDINTTEGAPVYAAADGTVQRIWEDPLMGCCVALSHAGDSCTVYKNLAPTLAEGVAEGEKIKEGQLLGAVGDTAMVEIAHEPHLHFEMTVAGVQVDPLDYFTENAVAMLSADSSYEK